MKFSGYLCVVALWLQACCPENLAAQAQSGSIAGQLRIARGSFPDHPIMVTLEGRGIVITTIYTDNEGRFGFNGLPGNIYHVVIREKEFLPVSERVNINPDTTPVAILTIYLNPVDASKTTSSKITGGNPHLADSSEYTKAIPKPARKEFDRGVKAEKAGRLDEAIRHYRKAIELAPDFYAARNNLGSDLLSQSRFDEAREQFEAVIKVNPTDSAAYFNLGNLYLLTHRTDEAHRWVEQGLSKEPDSAFGHFLQGSLMTTANKTQEAEASLRRSLQLDPKLGKAHLALVNLYLGQHRKDDAITELKVFLKVSQNDPLAPKATEVLKRLEASSEKP